MNSFLIFILGMVAGVVVARVWLRFRGEGKPFSTAQVKEPLAPLESKPLTGLVEKQAREKEENKRKILGILEIQSPLTNNHVEQLLGISDATATRYKVL